MYDDDYPATGRGERAPLSAPNPFKPVSFEERLSAPVKKSGHTERMEALRPGQLYRGGFEMPIYDDTGRYTAAPDYTDTGRYDEQPLSFHPPVYRPIEPQIPPEAYAQPACEPPPEATIPAYLKRAPLAPPKPLAPMPAPVYAPQRDAANDGTFVTSRGVYAPPEPPVVKREPILHAPWEAESDVAADTGMYSPSDEPPAHVEPYTPSAASIPHAEPTEPAKRSRMRRYRDESEDAQDMMPDTAIDATPDISTDVLPPLDPLLPLNADIMPASLEIAPPAPIEPMPYAPPIPFASVAPFDPAPASFFEDAPIAEPKSPGDAFDPYARFRDAEIDDPYETPAVPDEIEAFFGETGEPETEQPDVYQPDASAPSAELYADPYSDSSRYGTYQPDTYQTDTYQPDAPEADQPPQTQQKKAEARPAAQPKPKRPPIRVARLLSLIAIVVMTLFCLIAGGCIIADLAKNEQDMKEFRERYAAQNGVSPEQDASLVVLPSPGVTFAPTATPAPVQTATPAPVFAVNDPGMEALNRLSKENEEKARKQAEQSGAQTPIPGPTDSPEPTALPRPKLLEYPNNPLGNVLEEVQKLQSEYPDAVGRLVIEGVLDEVVMQRNNTFYLTHNHRGTSSQSGAVFVDESCQFRTPPENLLLRGQSGTEGKTFAPLWQYEKAGSAFVASSAIATLLTPYEQERYVLFAVIVADSDPSSPGYFSYASHPSFTTDEEMLGYVDSAISRSLYRFNVSVDATDRLLTLATVGGDQHRTLVLMFRMMRAGEGAR